MKRLAISALAMAVFGAEGLALSLMLLLTTPCSSAQANGTAPHYIVRRLGSLGGTVGRSNGVNDRGWVSGWSNLTGDTSHHAVLWLDGRTFDLGTLGGPNSEIEFTATNDFGLLAGGSDTANIDPYDENFCFFTATDNHLCSAFQWHNGVMSALHGLGGNNTYATDSNRLGHIVGWAETVLDPNCLAPQVFDWHGALWKEGEVQDLPPLPGDVGSAAMAINDLDVAAGGGGPVCGSPGIQGFSLSTHVLIWRDRWPTNLGSPLGGQFNNIATGINNRGQVTGMSDLPGDATAHAFLWQDGAINDLGTLGGDVFSVAWEVSERGQVMGQSCDANGNCRGFLWQNGVMTDLNALVSAESSLMIIDANDINAAGEITGQAYDPVTGEMPAIELIPCAGTDDPECRSDRRVSEPVTLPQNVRDTLQKKRLHFGR